MPVNINFLPDIITSRANPLLIKVGKLEDKKHRDADGIFRVDGIKLFCEAVKCGAEIEQGLHSATYRAALAFSTRAVKP